MSGRLPAHLLVSGLIRATEAEGGSAMLLARGEAMGGALLVILAHHGRAVGVRERGIDAAGTSAWIATGPSDPDAPGALSDYIARRRRFDPDLWVVEIDVDPARVETLLALV